MIATSPAEFAAAVDAYRFDNIAVAGEPLALAQQTLLETGLVLVGEAHGVYETPSALYSVARALRTRALGLEWSHEELEAPVQDFMERGEFDFEQLWSLPASAEFFSGDGRFTAGHFALMQRLRNESRLDQVIVFDRHDPVPHPGHFALRDRELAERLLAEWDGTVPLLVPVGAFHARLDVDEGETMAMRLTDELPGLQPAMLQYPDREAPPAPITLKLAKATPAVLPGLEPGP